MVKDAVLPFDAHNTAKLLLLKFLKCFNLFVILVDNSTLATVKYNWENHRFEDHGFGLDFEVIAGEYPSS